MILKIIVLPIINQTFFDFDCFIYIGFLTIISSSSVKNFSLGYLKIEVNINNKIDTINNDNIILKAIIIHLIF